MNKKLWLWMALLCAMPLSALADEAPVVPVTPAAAAPVSPAAGDAKAEANCTDRKDDDGDGMVDCADHDCAKDPGCKVGSGPENTNARCSDWFDNDGDGFVDCDDPDCEGSGVTVCKGSWKGEGDTGPAANMSSEDMPELKDGMTVEDLLGKGGDKDGERSDEVCSDGVDNDNDGRVDCADFGCRFDPDVTICRGNPGMRFSIVAGLENSILNKGVQSEWDAGTVKSQYETRFARLQLRSFGPMPMIQNSFYLISIRAERDTRTTFAMFQVPLGRSGHYLNVNSGGGGLSAALITSTSKQLLLDPAYYMYSSFEQSNGAAVEVGGPLSKNRMFNYRAFLAGGSGRSTGTIGGTYYVADNTNYTWSVGGQVAINVIGAMSRFDSPFLYTGVPTTLGFTVGGKFDQRTQERYPAVNLAAVFRHKRLYAQAEMYGKYSLDYGNTPVAWNVQAGVLVIPKWLLLAADYGELVAGELKDAPANLETTLKKQLDERQFRAAAHLYFYRNIGMLSLLFRHQEIADYYRNNNPTKAQEFVLSTQFRF